MCAPSLGACAAAPFLSAHSHPTTNVCALCLCVLRTTYSTHMFSASLFCAFPLCCWCLLFVQGGGALARPQGNNPGAPPFFALCSLKNRPALTCRHGVRARARAACVCVFTPSHTRARALGGGALLQTDDDAVPLLSFSLSPQCRAPCAPPPRLVICVKNLCASLSVCCLCVCFERDRVLRATPRRRLPTLPPPTDGKRRRLEMGSTLLPHNSNHCWIVKKCEMTIVFS